MDRYALHVLVGLSLAALGCAESESSDPVHQRRDASVDAVAEAGLDTGSAGQGGGGTGGSGGSAGSSQDASSPEAATTDAADDAPAVDTDNDGVIDPLDPCPNDPNQWTDADHDGHCDEVDDDCPTDPGGWKDTTNDGLCNGDDDNDQDGITNAEEMVYGLDCSISNPDQADSDADGIADNQDLYPRDTFPEYILFRNDNGTVDLMLSNRDGTFQSPVEIGALFGCTPDAQKNCGNTAYRYTSFVIADFDNNGRTDALVIGDPSPEESSSPVDLWWFTRARDASDGTATTFTQRLVDGALDKPILGTAADANNDDRIDLITLEITKPANITEAYFFSFINMDTIAEATCAYTTDPTNPNGCAFLRKDAANLHNLVNNQWSVVPARDSVDVNGDGFRDLVILTMPNGGDCEVPVYLLAGNGDGTFDVPSTSMFSHNNGACGGSPANSILFADFTNDHVGDVILGLDDDGDSGSAWYYPGQVSGGSFSFNFGSCQESFDIYPECESGCADDPGVSSSARAFDFDFDGNLDIMLGWNTPNVNQPPSKTILLMGNGNGSFQPPATIRDFPSSSYGSSFATPQGLCARFQIQ